MELKERYGLFFEGAQIVYSDNRRPWTSNEYEVEIDRRGDESLRYNKIKPNWDGYSTCITCGNSLVEIKLCEILAYKTTNDKWFRHCNRCGWWALETSCFQSWSDWPSVNDHKLYWPIMKQFNITALETPIKILRNHLRLHYSDISMIPAQKAEELVLSVFKDVFSGAEVNYFRGHTFCADDGIDLVIVDVNQGRFGVQVKRRITNRSEPVDAVDRFVTALIKNGIMKGIYVTVGNRFSSIAKKVPNNQFLKKMGLELELMDSERFYDLLKANTGVNPEPSWIRCIGEYNSCSNQEYLNRLISESG